MQITTDHLDNNSESQRLDLKPSLFLAYPSPLSSYSLPLEIGSHYVAHAGFEETLLLPEPPKCQMSELQCYTNTFHRTSSLIELKRVKWGTGKGETPPSHVLNGLHTSTQQEPRQNKENPMISFTFNRFHWKTKYHIRNLTPILV